jgi:hypothetical protein
MATMPIKIGIPIPRPSLAPMVMPFGAGDGDDEEVGDCMVDIDGNVVDEGKVVAVAESKVDAVVAEDDPD